MQSVIQRVKSSKVTSKGDTLGEIDKGLLVLLGVDEGDGEEETEAMAEKILKLRIFPSKHNDIDTSVKNVEGEILVVPQFTLCADTSKGNRPSFVHAASPDKAKELYQSFVEYLRENSDLKIETGEFGAMMDVELVNWGPVTIML